MPDFSMLIDGRPASAERSTSFSALANALAPVGALRLPLRSQWADQQGISFFAIYLTC
ncbi:hypothetical protein [Variovorax terrae]|uniref:Uncharacterized protein n=1 Tax=Variovorax terrae TaxID=2923278 RepID=A0A9X1VWR3_9BURK|nr:hypothetical protein [Variovorax terrae]MCJ0764832.1 hypothetical protein [Variovorax terrae]